MQEHKVRFSHSRVDSRSTGASVSTGIRWSGLDVAPAPLCYRELFSLGLSLDQCIIIFLKLALAFFLVPRFEFDSVRTEVRQKPLGATAKLNGAAASSPAASADVKDGEDAAIGDVIYMSLNLHQDPEAAAGMGPEEDLAVDLDIVFEWATSGKVGVA